MFLISKAFPKRNNQANEREQMQTAIYRSMLKREAAIGGSLFGPVPAGGRREFFCLDESTWIWHEEWIDESGQKQIRNTRYDLRPESILKAQNGQGYQMVGLEEARNLQAAVNLYVKRVNSELYSSVA